MFGAACLLLILAAKGGSCRELKTKQQTIEVCSNAARLYPHPNDCRKFLRCINRKQVSMSCPPRTVFDPAMQICGWRVEDGSCSPEHQDVDAGEQRAHNQTRNIPIVDSTRRAPERTKSTSFRPKSNLQPVAYSRSLTGGRLQPVTYMSTAASSKQKTSKAETGFSVNKIQHAVGEYIKPKPRYPETSYGFDMGTIANQPQLSYKNINLSSAGTATASIKPTTTTTYPAVIPGPGTKWYHTMNFITTPMSTSALPSGHSQTLRTASHQLYDTRKITDNSKENSVRKQIRKRKTDRNDSLAKQIPSGDGPAYDAQESKHLKSGVLDETNQEISNHLLGSAIRVRNEHNHGNKTGRIEDNKEGKGELIQEFTSISVDDVHNSTAETDNSEMMGVSSNEGRNNSRISGWVGREEKKSFQQLPGIPSLDNSIALSVQPLTTSENETDTAKTAIPIARYATEKTTKSSQIAHNYVLNKNTTSETERYNDTNSLQLQNTSADNTSFDDVDKLIQPYRVRLDRKQNMRPKEKPADDIDDVPSEDDENRISSDQTWEREEVKLVPGLLEHLTAKIVDKDLLVPEAKTKWLWYDKTPGTDTFGNTTPTTDTTVGNITPTTDTAVGNITPSTNNAVNSRTNIADSRRHLSADNDNLVTPTNVARSKAAGPNGSEPHRVRDEGTADKSGTALPTPAAKTASSFGAGKTAELTSIGESGVDELTAGPAEGSDETRSAPLLSAPYLATGLARPFRCPEMNGHFPDATNCAVYYRCSRGQAFKRDCPSGKVFQSSVKSCVSSNLAPPCASAYTDAVQEDQAFARSICKEPDGLYRDNVSCAHYFECTNGWPIRRQCMMGTVYDDVVSKCSWSKFVPGCEHQTTPEVEINVSGVGQNIFLCPRDGYFREPRSCDVYYLCAGNQALRMTCDPGTSFDVTLNMCAWNHLVDDCRNLQVQLAADPENTVAAMTLPKSYTSALLEPDAPESLQQEFQCPEKNGIFPLVEDCGIYYVCADGVARQMSCPADLGYDVASGVCLERGQVPQCAASAGHQDPREESTPFSCPEAHGLYSDSSNCSFFVHCFKKVAHRHECQPGTLFSPTNAACTWSQLVPECRGSGQVKPEVSQAFNTGFVEYSTTGHRGVPADTYQQQIVKPATYKVQPVDVQEFTCPDVQDGFFRDNVFCDIFHRCVMGKKFTFTCPEGTFFRLDETLCDFWEAVTDCTSDGVRVQALGGQASVVVMSQSERVQQQVPDHFQLSIVNIDADPIGCPASGGLFPHPRNCRQFVFCSRFVPLVLTCPEPLLFNPQTLTCDFAMKVHCFRSDDYRRK